MDSKRFEKLLSTQKNRNSVANMVSKANQRGNRNVRQRRKEADALITRGTWWDVGGHHRDEREN